MRPLVFLVFGIIAVIGIAARLISGFHGSNPFRLPCEPEPLAEPLQHEWLKREANKHDGCGALSACNSHNIGSHIFALATTLRTLGNIPAEPRSLSSDERPSSSGSAEISHEQNL